MPTTNPAVTAAPSMPATKPQQSETSVPRSGDDKNDTDRSAQKPGEAVIAGKADGSDRAKTDDTKTGH